MDRKDDDHDTTGAGDFERGVLEIRLNRTERNNTLTPRPGATAVSTPTVSCWRPRSLKILMITAINGMAIDVGGWHGEPDLR